MNLEEMQNVWGAQTNDNLFEVNMERLRTNIQQKKQKLKRNASFLEWFVIGVNLLGGTVYGWLYLTSADRGLGSLVIALIMLSLAGFIYRARYLRLRAEYELSVLGAVKEGIATARHKVRLSLASLGFFSILCGVWWYAAYLAGKSPLFLVGMLGFFVVAFALSLWEHSWCHVRGLRKMQKLKEELLRHTQAQSETT